MKTRKNKLKIMAGNLQIGGGAPVSIQSMTNVPIEDIEGTIRQITRLEEAGADLVRLAVRNEDAIEPLKKIIKSVKIPLCADIHFNHKLAIGAIKAGIHKVRINPGNIGDDSRVKEVIAAAKDAGVPIRIGVNGGSIDRKKYSSVTAESLVDSAIFHLKILEDNNFYDTAVSIKSSEVLTTIEANILFSDLRDYPIHVGLTEAGYGLNCTVQSSIAIGHLILSGIGDTIRVSMTGDPVDEIIVAKKILQTTGDRVTPIKIISCPTCGRTDPGIDILKLATEVDMELGARFEKKLLETKRSIHVAVMGCEVNGPGEAADADAGLAGGRDGKMLLFSKGKKLRIVNSSEAVPALVKEIERIIENV